MKHLKHHVTDFCCSPNILPAEAGREKNIHHFQQVTRIVVNHQEGLGLIYFIWVFPKIMLPPNHPLKNRGFPLFSPSILGVFPPPIFGSTSIYHTQRWPIWDQLVFSDLPCWTKGVFHERLHNKNCSIPPMPFFWVMGTFKKSKSCSHWKHHHLSNVFSM